MSERQLVLTNDRLEFAVNRKMRRLGSACAAYVGTPGGELLASFFRRLRFIINHVIDFAAKGVEGGHAVAFGLGQQHKSQRKVRSAVVSNRSALLHDYGEASG